jgi:phage baseplate assembly protein V
MSGQHKAAGLVIAVVKDRDDPDGLGRVKVSFPTYQDRESEWVPVLVPYGGAAGQGHGFYSVPEKDAQVLVAFLEGDRKSPIVIGCLYSDQQKPPSDKPEEHVLKSKNGHVITISDESGSERIEIQTKGGQKVTLDEGAGTVTVKAKQKVVVDAPAIELGSGAMSEHAILGDTFMKLFATHTHTVLLPTLMTGPVTPPVPAPLVTSTITTLKG